MKSILTFIIGFIFIGINAQQVIYSKKNLPMQENIQTHHNEIRSIFSELNTNNIPTGILVDAAIEFADLSLYNGSLSDNSFTSAKVVKDIYHTLMTGKLSERLENFITPADFNHTWYEASQERDIIPIGGIYYRYDKFSNAVSQSFKQHSASRQSFSTPIIGYNAQRNKILGNGSSQQMYETNEVFALAPSVNTFNKLNFQVVFPREIFIVKDYSLIKNIELKTAEGRSFTPISFDKLVEVSYPAEGEYRWTFRVTLNNGKQLLSHTKVKIENVLSAGSSGNLSTFATSSRGVSSWAYTYKHELDTYKVRKSPFIWSKKIDVPLATIYVRLANGNTQIRKPLIVAEGFDTGHITTPNKEGGDNNIATFLYGGNMNSNLLKDIFINNYDIIYVDWGKGTDYIQNNAELLKKAIRWVNENKVGTEKNVVLGQSMGGLVARYALKDMEDKGENHDTKLYISHDTPHLGANIPLGLQYMSRNISQTYLRTPIGAIAEYYVPLFNKGISPNDILTLQDTPAARQMLINYVDKYNRIDNSFHTAWQNELRAKGYPQKTRNVAISNGSECGSDQKPETLVRLYKETSEHYFINLLDALVGFGNLKLDMMIYSAIPGTSKYIFDFEVNPMLVLNQDKVIYRGKIRYEKKLFWFIHSQSTLLEGENKQPKNILPIDRYGGGVFKMFKDDLPIFKKDIHIGSFSFIPTPSAIDLYRGERTLTEYDYTNSYSYTKNKNDVPFSNFVVEPLENSHTHITFNNRIGDFIINQLSNDNNLQSKIITSENLCGNNIKIGGKAQLCNNTKSTYNVGNAEYIQWSVVKGRDLIDIERIFNQQEFSFTPKNNANGLVELQAYVREGNASKTISKKIWIGKPKVHTQSFPLTDMADIRIVSDIDSVNLAEQGITYNDIVWHNLTTGEKFTTSNYYRYIRARNDFETIKATVTNPCGTVEITTQAIRKCKDEAQEYIISRNNRADSYSLSIKNPITQPCISDDHFPLIATRSLNTDSITIQISNAMGQIVFTTKNKEFSLAHLLAGTYYARVIKNGQVVHTQTLLKQ